MTPTPKRKAPPANPLVAFWREFLFTREIYIDSGETPQVCASALRRQMSYSSNNFMDRHRQIVQVEQTNADHHTFMIEAQRKQKRGYGTTATARGVIFSDSETGKTIVQGNARFGVVNFVVWLIFAIFFSVMFLSELRNGSGGIFLVIMGGVFGWMLWQMFADRNRIAQELAQTIHYARPEKPVGVKSRNADLGTHHPATVPAQRSRFD